ncbi:sulfite exporter TauE/SafE family protein [Irregularibacter muris]|uniref:Probable membrane transporter protein n=1 Tax=Irregularibacter muris TaxID=1796619 RepID=A0AAE3HGK7_9FIRM|nr:sulfite exporter TauE/SafE family protein [Irregularibacter muris]MCR1899786.1 sulfite exporter TauE/SafE family protein [Irregularibacter muris]
MINVVLGALGIFVASFAVVFGLDLNKHKGNLEQETSWATTGIAGLIINFMDTLGIGSFAPLTATLRGFKQVEDKVLPGTLNVSCTIPVVLEAFLFISAVEVEIITLICMLGAAVVGAVIGAGIVSKLPEKTIQMVMGIALVATAFLMLAGQLNWIEGLGTGTALGLSGTKLILAIVGNFILGALMTAGIGLYAPCMALVYVLGMSPAVAFPIMMGSCAFLMPAASMKFVREGAYNRKASLGITIGGIIGVIIAVRFFSSLSLDLLTWLVIVVVSYTAITLLKSAFKPKSVDTIVSE